LNYRTIVCMITILRSIKEQSIMNVPNLLTVLRLLLVPIVVVLYYLPIELAHVLATLLFALAAVTDWLDGYLARNLKQMTKFGAFLDPVADKLMIAVALVLVVGELRLPFLAIPAAIIVGREIVVSALREWMAEIGKRTSLAVNMVAKIKTLAQMVSLILLMLYRPGDSILLQIGGSLLLYIAAALTLWSMVMYLKIAWPDLTLFPEQE
jgi:CDP-diacylglycerol--glycerol-3-phosphate 3-phosphatidyltransferase